jgi:cellulose synthase/poly-beta-1,6-N-acetylglucosamine synthase-like glycosyltransferase
LARRASSPLALLITAYFVLWNVSQMAMSPLRGDHVVAAATAAHAACPRPGQGVFVKPLVSIVVPAYNEELTIVESIHALLALD